MQLRSRLREWFTQHTGGREVWAIIPFVIVLVFSATVLTDFQHSLRLASLGQATAVTITSSWSQESISPDGPVSLTSWVTLAEKSGNFRSDGAYRKGDHAVLISSSDLDYRDSRATKSVAEYASCWRDLQRYLRRHGQFTRSM